MYSPLDLKFLNFFFKFFLLERVKLHVRTLKVNLDKLQLKKEKNESLLIHFIYMYIYMVSKNFKNTPNLTL